MQNEDGSPTSTSSSDSNHGERGSERVEDIQEAYRRALVELVAKVMHPPDFTKSTGISQRTSRYEWCMNINKLLRKFKSINAQLAPADVPPSFKDLDAFVRDACQFAFTDEVTGFYQKWPVDLDVKLEESFKTGKPLGRMMIGLPLLSKDVNEEAGSENRIQSQLGSAAGSAADPRNQRNQPSRSRAASDVSSSSASSTIIVAHRVTPTTPTPLGGTPSLDSRAQTSTQSSGTTPLPQTPSSSTISPKRFTVKDFEQLVREASKSVSNSSPTMSRARMQPRRGPAASFSPTVQHVQHSENPSASPVSFAPPPPPSLTPVPEPGRSFSLRRSVSERPWIPESFRDGSMAPDMVRTYTELDKVCEEADILIFEAHGINARDGNETRLKDWTERARDCEVKGRKYLSLIENPPNEISESGEVAWAKSTLRLLKGAHVELIEFAQEMLKDQQSSSNPCARVSIPQARIEAVRNLQPAIRNSIETTAPPESRAATINAPTPRPEVRPRVSRPGPSRSSAGRPRRMFPYIDVPQVPWKWRPAPPVPVSDSESEGEAVPTSQAAGEPKPNKKRINTSIVIRSRQVAAPGSSASSQSASRDYRTIKLQRMADRAPGDKEFVPACSVCAQRGFSCFGKPGSACRRCKRIKKGGCTYSRKVGGAASATVATTKIAGKGKGKGKEVARPKPSPKGKAAAKTSKKGKSVERGTKRTRSGRSSGVLQKLRKARMRMEKERRKEKTNAEDSDEESESEESSSEDESDSDYVSDGDANVRMPARKRRRRGASARATHEPETSAGAGLEPMLQDALHTRATSEPPDNNAFHMRSPSRRPTLTSLAHSPSPPLDWNMEDTGLEGAPEPEQDGSGSGRGTGNGSGNGSGSAGADVDIDSQSTLRSTEPERRQAASAPRDRSSGNLDSDVQMENSQNTSERETEELMEVERSSSQRSGPEARLSVSIDVHHSPSPPQAVRTSVATSMPTPTSLSGASPTGIQVPLPSIAFPLPAPSPPQTAVTAATATTTATAGPSSAATTSGTLVIHPDPQRAQRTEALLTSMSTKIETMIALQVSLLREFTEGIRNLSEPPLAPASSMNADAAIQTSNTPPSPEN